MTRNPSIRLFSPHVPTLQLHGRSRRGGPCEISDKIWLGGVSNANLSPTREDPTAKTIKRLVYGGHMAHAEAAGWVNIAFVPQLGLSCLVVSGSAHFTKGT